MKSHRVLIADRDETLLNAYREYLLRDGFDVVTAMDGLDCVAKLRSFVPDLLVLDPELPWGRGDGVLAVMHEDADVPVVPVMVLSANYGEVLSHWSVRKELLDENFPIAFSFRKEQQSGRETIDAVDDKHALSFWFESGGNQR